MPTFKLIVNGSGRTCDSAPERPLLDVLREDFGLTGTKYGCGEGQCRACTVLLDDRPTPSCLTPVASAAGHRIDTIESLAGGGRLDLVQQAFIDADAMQCGYCTPGMILTAKALLKRTPQPSRDDVVAALNGNLCRCCGYVAIVEAVLRAGEAKAVEDA